MNWTVGSAQEIGKRESQEDAFGVRTIPGGVLAVLSDGMGGHAAGEVASRLAVAAVMDESVVAKLKDRFQTAQEDVLHAGRQPGQRGLGATLTAVGLRPSASRGLVIEWAHLGDSRLTLIRDNQTTWLTSDHSLPGQLYETGRLTEEEFDRGDGYPGLIQFIGMELGRRGQSDNLPVETGSMPVQPGDVILLTSDGVHGALRKGILQAIVQRVVPEGADALAKALVVAGVEAGGKHADNATCVAFLVEL